MPAVRYPFVDALRGIAILLMVTFHFCFDLAYFRLADFDFYRDPFWLHSRTFILSFFLLLVGVSLWLAHGRQVRLNRALKRAGLIAVNAALISMATWFMFADRLVYFGVLHFIVIASLLGLLFVRYRWLSLLVGFLLLSLNLVQHSWFDQPWHQWLGMMTHKPATEDYVPLVPWLGVVLIGVFLAAWVPLLGRYRFASHRALQPLALLGRHSLLIYMLHQPVLMGALQLLVFQ